MQTTTKGKLDVICLQEIKREGLSVIKQCPWIQAHWAITGLNGKPPLPNEHRPTEYAQVTMVNLQGRAIPDPRLNIIPLKSIFQRKGLQCQVTLIDTPLNIINVHLDSLDWGTSNRPLQMNKCSEYNKTLERGFIIGDFNAITEADESLIEANGFLRRI